MNTEIFEGTPYIELDDDNGDSVLVVATKDRFFIFNNAREAEECGFGLYSLVNFGFWSEKRRIIDVWSRVKHRSKMTNAVMRELANFAINNTFMC